MFWKKKELKAGAPTDIPSYIGKVLVTEMQKLPQASDHWVKYKMVIRPQSGKTDTYDVRVIDEWELGQKGAKVSEIDYAFLDKHPDLIEFAGWFNSTTHQVEVKAGGKAEKPPEKAKASGTPEKPPEKAKT